MNEAQMVEPPGDAARRAFRITHVGLVFQSFELVSYLNVFEKYPAALPPEFSRCISRRKFPGGRSSSQPKPASPIACDTSRTNCPRGKSSQRRHLPGHAAGTPTAPGR